MDKIIDNNHLQSLIKDNDFIVLFSNSRCVCNSLKIKIDDYFNEEKNIKIMKSRLKNFRRWQPGLYFSTPVVISTYLVKKVLEWPVISVYLSWMKKLKRLKDLI